MIATNTLPLFKIIHFQGHSCDYLPMLNAVCVRKNLLYTFTTTKNPGHLLIINSHVANMNNNLVREEYTRR